jgi:hypothetical protein
MAVVATTQQTTLQASTAGGRGQRFVRTGRTAPGLFIAVPINAWNIIMACPLVAA